MDALSDFAIGPYHPRRRTAHRQKKCAEVKAQRDSAKSKASRQKDVAGRARRDALSDFAIGPYHPRRRTAHRQKVRGSKSAIPHASSPATDKKIPPAGGTFLCFTAEGSLTFPQPVRAVKRLRLMRLKHGQRLFGKADLLIKQQTIMGIGVV